MSGGYTHTLQEIDEVLDGIRENLIKVLIVGIIGTIVGYAASFWLIEAIEMEALRMVGDKVEIIQTEPLEVILLQIKISVIIGFLIALPLIAYYLYNSIDDRIERFDLNINLTKSQILLTGLASVLLFVGGVLYAFYIMMPLTFRVLVLMTEWVDPGIGMRYTISSFMNLVLLFILAFGLAFQLPVVLNLSIRSGLVSYEYVKSKRKAAYLIIIIVAAAASEPTFVTQVLIAVPLIFFFEVSLVWAKFSQRRARKKEMKKRAKEEKKSKNKNS